jgi:hypothetical protein
MSSQSYVDTLVDKLSSLRMSKNPFVVFQQQLRFGVFASRNFLSQTLGQWLICTLGKHNDGLESFLRYPTGGKMQDISLNDDS